MYYIAAVGLVYPQWSAWYWVQISGEASVVWVIMQTSAEGVRHPRGVRGHGPPKNVWNIDPRNAICSNLSIKFQKIAWSNDGGRCGYFGIFQTTINNEDRHKNRKFVVCSSANYSHTGNCAFLFDQKLLHACSVLS
jgi:hypothetical protein